MNPVLDHVCQRFGAYDCASASLMDIMSLFFVAALAGIAAVWLFGRVIVSD